MVRVSPSLLLPLLPLLPLTRATSPLQWWLQWYGPACLPASQPVSSTCWLMRGVREEKNRRSRTSVWCKDLESGSGDITPFFFFFFKLEVLFFIHFWTRSISGNFGKVWQMQVSIVVLIDPICRLLHWHQWKETLYLFYFFLAKIQIEPQAASCFMGLLTRWEGRV